MRKTGWYKAGNSTLVTQLHSEVRTLKAGQFRRYPQPTSASPRHKPTAAAVEKSTVGIQQSPPASGSIPVKKISGKCAPVLLTEHRKRVRLAYFASFVADEFLQQAAPPGYRASINPQ